MPLTPKQEAFVREYLIDSNATQAAIRAGYSKRTANEQGARLLANVSVRRAVEDARAALAVKAGVKAEDVLRRLWAIATADPNELIEFRRTCCRHCHGKGHKYQYTLPEQERRKAAWWKKATEARRKGKQAPEPLDEGGGVGYDARKPPHPDCPECFGEGTGLPFPKDTRGLSPAAQALYAGLKVTRDGIELKMHDQLAALRDVGRHLGMFSGEGDTGGNHLHLHLAADQLRKLPPDELRKLYLEALRAPAEAEDEAGARP